VKDRKTGDTASQEPLPESGAGGNQAKLPRLSLKGKEPPWIEKVLGFKTSMATGIAARLQFLKHCQI
jgi:hypothetical protein